SGTVLTSTDPTGGAADWVPAAIDTTMGNLRGVTCDEPTHCIAFDHYGLAFASTDPTGGAAAWSPVGTIDSTSYGVGDMSCVPESICVGVDMKGDAVVGSPPPPPSVSLGVALGGDGNGSVTGGGITCPGTCSANYSPGTSVALAATPAAGGQFVGWSGACHGTGSCTVAMNGDANVTAIFAPLPAPAPMTLVTPLISPTPALTAPHKVPLAPPTPAITRLRVRAHAVTVTFAPHPAAIALECALVPEGAHARRPVFARCAGTSTFTKLRPGRYRLYARSLAHGIASDAITRALTIRPASPHAPRRH
ncbi:MAG: InlB B-repeat-containing protein, partial [Solirubrobacteraceae bacterium]